MYLYNDLLLHILTLLRLQTLETTNLQGVSGEPFLSGSQASCSLAFPHRTPFSTFTVQSKLLFSIAEFWIAEDEAADSWLSEPLLGPPLTRYCVVVSRLLEVVVVVVGISIGTGDVVTFGLARLDGCGVGSAR